VHYSEGTKVEEGMPFQVGSYKIKSGRTKHADKGSKTKFVIAVSNNIHQVPCLEAAEIVEEWTEEEKVAIKKKVAPKPEDQKAGEEGEKKEEAPAAEQPSTEQDFEIKHKKKSTTSGIDFDSASFALPPVDRASFLTLEQEMTKEDNRLLDWKKAKNDLETYSYNMRNNLDSYGSYEKYLEDGMRAEFLKNINETVEWLYGDGANAATADFTQRLEAFRTIGEPAASRYRYYSTVEEFFGIFEQAKKQIQEQLGSIAHLTDDQRKAVIEKAQVVEDFLIKVKTEFESKPRTQDPSFTTQDIENKL